jgi:hypothetical protein
MKEQPATPMAIHPTQDPEMNGSGSVPIDAYGVNDLKRVWSNGGAVERRDQARLGSQTSAPAAGHVLSTRRDGNAADRPGYPTSRAPSRPGRFSNGLAR